MDQNKEITLNDTEMYKYYDELAKSNKCFFGEFMETTKASYNINAYSALKRFDNLNILYKPQESAETLCMVDNVLMIFHKYFSEIPNLCYLLASNYTDIEVEMFLDHKEDGLPGRQRDHYIHQFRNAFMGLELLSEFKFFDRIEENLKKSDSFYKLYLSSNEKETEESIKEIVYKTYFIAALFHDIGYPLSFFIKSAKKIHEYTPFYKMINSNIKVSFVDVSAILLDSLLFKVVDVKNIEKRYNDNDHGCLSAISFLMHFYHSGTIHALKQKDKNVIQWAAVAIFNHTNVYKKTGTRMLFSQDPISYLLRICDDLQEWNRFSILMEETSNYLLCPNCNKIIRKTDDKKIYECGCKSKGEEHLKYTKITTIENKKLNYINLCKNMSIDEIDNGVCIKMEYNIYKQMQLLINDFTSVNYRKKDLEEVEKLLLFQDGFPEIKIERFLSNNIIELSEKALENADPNNAKSEIKELRKKIKEIKFNVKLENLEMYKVLTKKYKKREEDYSLEYISCMKKYAEELLPYLYKLDKVMKKMIRL